MRPPRWMVIAERVLVVASGLAFGSGIGLLLWLTVR